MKCSAILAAMAVVALALPALADTNHTAINFTCANPNPSTASAYANYRCSFSFAFGSSDSNKTDTFTIFFPSEHDSGTGQYLNTRLNEDGTHDGADPSDGEKVGQATVTELDLSYDGCGDANDGGTTHHMYWEDTWTSFTAPPGWTKVAEYTTVLTVLFLFTERAPAHVIKNNTTGQYAVRTDIPQDRGCAGATTTYNPWELYGTAGSGAWIVSNPPAAGDYTMTIQATEVGGTVHEDTDTVTIS